MHFIAWPRVICGEEDLGTSVAKHQNYTYFRLNFVVIRAKMLNSRRFIPVFVKRVRVLQAKRSFRRVSLRSVAHAQRTVQNILPR